MVIKGTLDASHALPTSGMTEGDTYIVGAKGTYNNIACKVGDFFVRTSDSWLRIPAGDEWEYNENTIKAIKVDNAGHADTADTAVSAGSANTATNATNADLLDGQDLITQVSDWDTDSLSIFKSSENSISNAPTSDFIYGVTLRFHRNISVYHTDLVTSLYHDRLFFRRKTEEGYQTWRELIHDGNIGSQSVNYATTSGACTGNAATATKLQTARTI